MSRLFALTDGKKYKETRKVIYDNLLHVRYNNEQEFYLIGI